MVAGEHEVQDLNAHYHTSQILRPVTFYETREELCLILSFQKQIAVVVDGHCNLFSFFFSFCMNDLVPPSASGGNVTVLYMEWVWVSLLTPLRHLLQTPPFILLC